MRGRGTGCHYRSAAWPALYGAIYPVMLEAAKGSGYALALHGSLGRDLDVIAVPWTEDAIAPEELVDRIGGAICEDWWLGHDGAPRRSLCTAARSSTSG